ncbi:Golgi apparatus membrane protein tvp23 [Xylographa carneopallida]|nr:Golgi apparatus membrane protein tvp23 [Xylographa carneopallida]
MEQQQQPQQPRQGDLSWRLSSHPVTLLCFLGFRICTACAPVSLSIAPQERFAKADHHRMIASLLVYLFGGLFVTDNFVLIFILTILLLAADFYYLKNIAGRRLVGLRWWNEVDPASGSSTWVFESSPTGVGGSSGHNKTDSRFFWLALYLQPVLWAGLGVLYILSPKWLSIVVIALILTITNTVAFSRCDRFSQATTLASSVGYSGGLARNLAGGLFSRLFTRS